MSSKGKGRDKIRSSSNVPGRPVNKINKKEAKLIEKYGSGKLTAEDFPPSWQHSIQLRKQDPIEMTEPYTDHLPKLKITLHSGKNLSKPNAFVKINIGTLQCEVIKSNTVKKTYDPEWNEEYSEVRIENGPDPFLCTVRAYVAKAIGSPDPIGGFEVDLYKDLGMRFSGDVRNWNFPLNSQGELTMTFTAITDFNFPIMKTNNVEGNPNTTMLPYKPNPEVEITIYQAVRLLGPKRLNSQVHVQLKTFDFQAMPGVKPEKAKSILKTRVFKGHSPFWGEKCRTALFSNLDSIKISLIYYKDKSSHKDEETICNIGLEELSKIATSSETRRWYAFTQKFKGTAIGIGIKALTNMKALDALPDPPHVLSVEEWNERQRNPNRYLPDQQFDQSQKSAEEDPNKVSQHLSNLLQILDSYVGMEEDITEDYLLNDPTSEEKSKGYDDLKFAEELLKEQFVRLGLEVSRQQLEGERERNKKELEALKEEKAKLIDDRSKLYDGGLASVGGKRQFQAHISNMITNINEDKPKKSSSIPDLIPDLTLETVDVESIISQAKAKLEILEPSIDSSFENEYTSKDPSPRFSLIESGNLLLNKEPSPRYGLVDSSHLSLNKEPSPRFGSLLDSGHIPSNRDPSPKKNFNEPQFIKREPSPKFTHKNPINQFDFKETQDEVTPSLLSLLANLPLEEPEEMVGCTLCKQTFPKSKVNSVRGKPFCTPCKERLILGAKRKGMNL